MTEARPGWNDEAIDALSQRLDNNGRWGPDDELGTLNFITDATRVAAAAQVRQGRAVSLSRPLVADASPTGRVELDLRFMYESAPDERLGTPPFVGDYLGLEAHQPGVTHLDAVGHIGSVDGYTYGRRAFREVVNDTGLHFGSILPQRLGVISRGVLLDIPAALDVEWLEPGHEVSAADLSAAERHSGTAVTSGDVIVVRVGIEAREAVHGPSVTAAGPGPEAAAWIHEREVAVYASDAPEHITPLAASILGRGGEGGEGEERATRYPLAFHQLALPVMGLCLVDHAHVEELAAVCRMLSRFEFLFVAVPLVIPDGTGSAVNPLAIF